MNKAGLEGVIGYLRMVFPVSRRLVDQLPEDKMGFRPTPESRSAAEIIAHNYTFLGDAADTAAKGEQVSSTEPTFTSKADLLAYMDQRVAHFFSVWETLTDAHLAKAIAAYEQEFAGWQFINFAYDEHWHHRGQFTVYLRLCGITPLMIYDY